MMPIAAPLPLLLSADAGAKPELAEPKPNALVATGIDVEAVPKENTLPCSAGRGATLPPKLSAPVGLEPELELELELD